MTSKSMTFRLPTPLAQAIEIRARTTGRDRTTVVTEALAQVFGLPELTPAPATIELLREQIEQIESNLALLSEQIVSVQAAAQTDQNALQRIKALEQLVLPLQQMLTAAAYHSDANRGLLEVEANSLSQGSALGEPEIDVMQLIAQLEEQSAAHKQILSTIPDPIFVCDRLGRFTYVNPVGARLLEREQGSLLGKTPQDLDLPTEFKEHLTAQHRTVFATGRPTNSEVSVSTAASGVRDYECILSPIQDRVDSISAVLCIARDITERKQAETALRESEANYRHLFESANDSIFIFDLTSRRILNANANAARRLGYTRQEILQLTIEDIDAPMNIDRRNAILQEVTARGNLICEHAHRHKDGTEIPIELSSRIIEYGDRLAVQSFVRDITERKRAEQALRKSEERFRRIFEDAPLGMAIMNCKTYRVTQANPAICQLFGYTEAELKTLAIEHLCNSEDVEQIVQVLQRVRAGENSIYQIEKRCSTKNQEAIWISLVATSFYDPEDDTAFLLMMVQDITRQHSAQP